MYGEGRRRKDRANRDMERDAGRQRGDTMERNREGRRQEVRETEEHRQRNRDKRQETSIERV